MKDDQILIQSRLDPVFHARVMDAAKSKRMTMARYIREALAKADREAREDAQANKFAEVISAQSEAIAALTQSIEQLKQNQKRKAK